MTHNFPPIANIHFRKQKVKQHLERIDPTKATGPDGIPGRVLRECSRELAGPVTQLFSLSFRRGVVPMLWKVASVVPVFKKPPKSNPCNYRPVSLLPLLSKAMESVVNHQLVAYLERYHLLPDSQYGFRQGRGTADVLTTLQNEWTRTVASGGCVPIVAVDIAGAFDRVSHCGLIHKVQQAGVRGSLLAWLQDYLTGRHLKVTIGGRISD